MKADRLKQGDTCHSTSQYPPKYYEIRVQGHLDSLWATWFGGMTISNVEDGESGPACTMISGLVADQPALHGLLTKIRDLNLPLISVRRIGPDPKISEEIQFDLTRKEIFR